MVAGGWGGESGKSVCQGDRVSVCEGKNVLEGAVVMPAQCESTQGHGTHLQMVKRVQLCLVYVSPQCSNEGKSLIEVYIR